MNELSRGSDIKMFENQFKKWVVILVIFLVLGITVPAHSARMLWDTFHGTYLYYYATDGFTTFSSIATGMGHTMEESSAGVMTHDLFDYCVLVLCFGSAWDSAYTTAEADKIEAYVNAGGSLLILAENPGCRNYNLDPVANRFGVTCGVASVTPADYTCISFTPHPIFTGVTSFFMRAAGTLSVTPPSIGSAWDLASDHQRQPPHLQYRPQYTAAGNLQIMPVEH